MERKSGVLMHVSSLFGDYSCGSFGKSAKYFIDFLSECGFSYWQVLPFNMTDEFNSPYKSYSTFSGNLNFVDLEILYEKGLLTKEELMGAKQNTPYQCEFSRLEKERFALLSKASQRVEDRSEIEKFIQENEHIASFCKFMALKSENPCQHLEKGKAYKLDEKALLVWQFIQYEFFTQWAKIKKYAGEKGVKIIGDVPMYVSSDSADVYYNPENFQLDEKGYPTNVAGVPPDYFSQDGQLWGNPLYDWDKMKTDNYKWWKDRIRHMSNMFDGVRIDHFRAIESYWQVPSNSKTAKDGKWEKGPGNSFVDEIKSVSENLLIIAEDLGDITKEVQELVEESAFPGMRVFQFGFLSDSESVHMPHRYCENCVAYTGTHDNNTLLGYLWELDEKTRKKVLSYCAHKDDWQSGCESIIREMFSSHARLVIFPIQDLLGYGCDTRMNTPGKPDGNWLYRITKEQLDSIDRGKFRSLNELYYRV